MGLGFGNIWSAILMASCGRPVVVPLSPLRMQFIAWVVLAQIHVGEEPGGRRACDSVRKKSREKKNDFSV